MKPTECFPQLALSFSIIIFNAENEEKDSLSSQIFMNNENKA